MSHGQVAQTALPQPRVPFNSLIFQARSGVKASVVEQLGSKAADVRVKLPRFVEEQSPVRSNCLRTLQKVFQGGDLRAVGMAASQRLVELLRIAAQKQIPCRP